MTTYFDTAQAELQRLRSDKEYQEYLRAAPGAVRGVVENAVRHWEYQLVADCTAAVYFPGYPHGPEPFKPLPDKFKLAVNETVLNYGIYTLPYGVDTEVESEDQFWSKLSDLCEHLHTVFHNVTRETGGSDNPKAFMTRLICEGDDDREARVEYDHAP